MSMQSEERNTMLPDDVGTKVSEIPVALSTRFLEHFSEQLYSSPQKAFEELISNGWDAGANIVDVRIAPDLEDSGATLAVFDNGVSMDEAGLRQLWHIAFSPKQDRSSEYGRPLIGKFGIGKLATYVLAGQLTHICKAKDGVIRCVTMDYREIDRQKGADSDRLINDLKLDVFELGESELAQILGTVYGGDEFLGLIKDGHPQGNTPGEEKAEGGNPAAMDEFGGELASLDRPEDETWTLVVLSHLKQTGKTLKLGILRRMLAAALPFGTEISIFVNGDKLISPKVKAAPVEEWVIGPDLGIDSIELDEKGDWPEDDAGDAEKKSQTDEDKSASLTKIPVCYGTAPCPHADIEGIGRITGTAKLFEEKISGGKSEDRGASNGFRVNVLGRIVNQDPSFGEENLNHAAWARFRMAVRADGLNKFLTTNREQFKECREIRIFRAFLRKVFNRARTVHDSDDRVIMHDGGDELVKSLGIISLNPLRNVVREALRTGPVLPDMFDETGIADPEEKRKSWRESTAKNIRSALDQVRYEELPDKAFVKFRIRDNSIVVNKGHPFVMEHSGSKAEKELVRTVAMIDLLADVYALDIGIGPGLLSDVRNYRDRLMCFRALQRRESGIHIARLLQCARHDSESSRKMEILVSDALRYLGFDVSDLAGKGEPDGIARACPLPAMTDPTEADPRPLKYSFSFDAKTSKHPRVKTGNISLDAAVEHRKKHDADYSLVVAPEFSEGALVTRCEQQKVTPMRAQDLGKLLEYTARYGAIAFQKFRKAFEHFDPCQVSEWVSQLEEEMRTSRVFTIDVFIEALKELRGKVPDTLSASLIAYTCRESLGAVSVQDKDVIALVTGLQIIVPHLVKLSSNDKVIVNASPSSVANAIRTQLDKLQPDETDV